MTDRCLVGRTTGGKLVAAETGGTGALNVWIVFCLPSTVWLVARRMRRAWSFASRRPAILSLSFEDEAIYF